MNANYSYLYVRSFEAFNKSELRCVHIKNRCKERYILKNASDLLPLACFVKHEIEMHKASHKESTDIKVHRKQKWRKRTVDAVI